MMISTGAILGFLSVALGAFGAHALKGQLAPGMTDVFETAVQYHAIHALAILLTGMLMAQFPDLKLVLPATLFIAGILMFSGSLYLLAITGIKWFGPVTPIGGLALLAGWATLAWQFLRA